MEPSCLHNRASDFLFLFLFSFCFISYLLFLYMYPLSCCCRKYQFSVLAIERLRAFVYLFLNSGMAISSCFFSSAKVDRLRLPCNSLCNNMTSQRFDHSLRKNMKMFGSITSITPNLGRNIPCRKGSAVHASSFLCSQIANGAFTFGTVAVLPFYTLMVIAPQAEFTKKVVGSSLPYVVLGALYGYLLYLSWTPDTIQIMFASKYLLPELQGMAKMFSSEMTLASAWIHLLTIDLFAARQVYGDGLENNIETRHSVSLCLLFCPIGILAHVITKALTRGRKVEFSDEETISSDFIK